MITRNDQIIPAIKFGLRTMARQTVSLGNAFRDVAEGMRAYTDSVLATFTLAEIREAKASGIPLLDYWAFWESRG